MCGENGSGKTAVLHGLQMCLGVSAKQSGRVSSGGEFIRDGANHCKAAATLWNTGEDAYLPRKFGPQITIEREMRRTNKNGATSTWTLKDAKGRKVCHTGCTCSDPPPPFCLTSYPRPRPPKPCVANKAWKVGFSFHHLPSPVHPIVPATQP